MAGPGTDRGDASLTALVRDLSEQSARLVRDEIALARAEMGRKARMSAVAVALLAGAALLGLMMAGAAVAAAVAALALALPVWAAALIVAGACAAIAALLALLGVRGMRRATPPAPADAMRSAREDWRWVTTRS